MEKTFDVGTEVLVFKYIKEYDNNQPLDKFIKGTITKCIKTDKLSFYRNCWYGDIYEVTDSNENVYLGNYGQRIVGSYFFLTLEDYCLHLMNQNTNLTKEIEFLRQKILNNNKKIAILSETNDLPNNNEELDDIINNNIKVKSKKKISNFS